MLCLFYEGDEGRALKIIEEFEQAENRRFLLLLELFEVELHGHAEEEDEAQVPDVTGAAGIAVEEDFWCHEEKI